MDTLNGVMDTLSTSSHTLSMDCYRCLDFRVPSWAFLKIPTHYRIVLVSTEVLYGVHNRARGARYGAFVIEGMRIDYI